MHTSQPNHHFQGSAINGPWTEFGLNHSVYSPELRRAVNKTKNMPENKIKYDLTFYRKVYRPFIYSNVVQNSKVQVMSKIMFIYSY